MKTQSLLLLFTCFLVLFSCKKDEEVSCVTCTSTETSDFQVCRESDGSASVNGQNTGTPYDVYIQGLEDAGANCGA